MEFETLADLVEAYGNRQLDENTPLLFDEESGIVYIERINGEDLIEGTEGDGDEDDQHRFRLNLQQFIVEAANMLGIPIDLEM